MRIYMQIPAMDSKPPRFCSLTLQQDLLEGWTLIRETGYQGSAGRVRREHFPDRESAERALMSARDAQLLQGYQVVFAQGQGQPK
jgi:predicted DNA-binding WGR domain protein